MAMLFGSKLKILGVVVLSTLIMTFLACGSDEETAPAPAAPAPAPAAPAPAPAPAPAVAAPVATAVAPQPIPTVAAAQPAPAPTAVPSTGGKAVYGGTLKTVMNGNPVGWDMHVTGSVSWRTQQILSFTHSRLMEWVKGTGTESDMTVVPDTAESWESPDALTYILKIKPGIKFHNGREMTSDDVKWTIDRMMIESSEKRLFPTLESIDATDSHTVQFNLSEPFYPFMANLASQTVIIYGKESGKDDPEKAAGKDFRGADTVMGTGPFVLNSYQEDSIVKFDGNPDYWREGLPYLDKLDRLLIKDSATRLSAFRTGQVDVMAGGISVSHQDFPIISKIDDVDFLKYRPWSTGGGIAGNTNLEPFSDVRFRRAIGMAIDREAWMEAFYPEGAVGVPGPLPVISPDYIQPADLPAELKMQWEYHPDESAKLIKEMGLDGSDLTIHTSYASNVARMSRTELIMDYLSKIGLNAEINVMEYAQWLKTANVGKIEEGIIHYGGATMGNPIEWIHFYIPGDRRNRSSVDDPEMYSLFDRYAAATTADEAKQVLSDFVNYYHETFYQIFMPQPISIEAWYDRTKNFTPKSTWDYGKRFEIVWLEQ